MNLRPQTLADPEDMFNDTRMTVGEHIEDLRNHLFRAGYALILGILVSLLFADYMVKLIVKPVEDQLLEYWKKFYDEKKEEILEALKNGQKIHDQDVPMPKIHLDLLELARKLNLPTDKIDSKEHWIILEPNPREYAESWIGMNIAMKPPALSTLSVQEAFMVYMMVCAMTGLVLSSPWVFYQLWSFVAAGLYPQEKRLVNVYLPYSIVLFLAGVGLCEIFAIPNAIKFLLWFNNWLGLQPDLRLSEWLGFAIFMPLMFGLSFQMPLVMLFASRIGVVDSAFYRAKRLIAVFSIAVVTAIISPSPDLLSWIYLAVSMWLLYELGIWLCVWHERHDDPTLKTPDSQETIEV